MNTLKKDLFYEFDGFRVEVGQKCLWHGEEIVPLTAKAFDTLLVLVENNGRLVEKDALLNEVWAETFVEESTLAQNISTIRKAFASLDRGTQFIETVPRRGYRFLRDVRQFESEDDLYLIETRTSTRVVAEKTEIHDTNPPALIPTALKIIRRHRIPAAGSIIGLVILAGAYFFIRPSILGTKEKFTILETSSIVSSGEIGRMAVSPDGKYIALVEGRNGLNSLRVRQTNNANSVELIPPSDDEYIGMSFSPSGDSIVYSVYSGSSTQQPGPRQGVLYKVPVLGGARTEILKDIDSAATISPDAKKVAFIRQIPSERQSNLVVKDIDPAGAEKVLASRPLKTRFSPSSLAWAPDGTRIAVVTVDDKDPNRPMAIASVSVDSGELNSLTAEPWMWVGQLAWLADSSALLFPAYNGGSPNITDEIWLLRVADGKSRRITNGINGVFGVNITADSQSIVAVRSSRVSGLWVSSDEEPETAKNINKSFGDNSLGTLGMDWTALDEIIYSSAANGNADIWIVKSDGSDARQLTDDPHADFAPVVSPDDKHIFFLSNRSGSNGIWRMLKNGTGVTELARLRDASSLSISPDGLWVYLAAAESKTRTTVLWKIPAGGGEPVQLTNKACFMPQISPDGSQVVCYFPEVDKENRLGLMRPSVLTSDGATVVKQFTDLSFKDVPLFWTRDGKGISYQRTVNGVTNIFVQKIEGGPPHAVTNFQTDEIFRYRWSPDGKKLAFEKGLKINDIFMIRDKGN
jgi:Tol biopolymer transport system component/DNA-binding winged helix-turn-helix (wHTH) protein